MFNSKYWLAGFGLIISIALLTFYLHTRSVTLDIGKTEQQARAEAVQKKLEEFTTVSNLLSRFIQEDINEKNYSKTEIENKLQQFLRSSPSDVVFGIGIWFEPFQFQKNQKFFGPYVHQSDLSTHKLPNILTYEWNTPEYNYHSQDWYKKGISNLGEGYFVNPYFDNGLVYVTNARAFFDKAKRIAGVISVDLVLPQLQSIIQSANQSPQELLYISDRNGMLLAHPLKEQFFKKKKNC